MAASDDQLRCAPWTREQGVDPIGSAPRFDALLLVEWPLPWPSDIADIPELAAAATDPRGKVFTVVPAADHATDGLHRVVHHRRLGAHRLVGLDHRVRREEVPELLARLLADVDGEHAHWPSAVGPAAADVLVCAHGRRDPCCGRWGTLLQPRLALRAPTARVWRCSHTGGHRFAPTAITVADGRAWAFTDADLLVGVLARSIPVTALHGHDRGSAALDPWGQAVERALFEEAGWGWLDGELGPCRSTVAADGRSATVVLSWRTAAGTAHQAQGEVVVTRDVPVLVCGLPPEAAKKSSYELGLRRLVVDGEERTLRASA